MTCSGQGGAVTVLSPKGLRERIVRALDEARGNYGWADS